VNIFAVSRRSSHTLPPLRSALLAIFISIILSL